MMEHTTDRLFWTLTSVIVGALILTIGIKAFPGVANSTLGPMSSINKQAGDATKRADSANNQAIQEALGKTSGNTTDSSNTKNDKPHDVSSKKHESNTNAGQNKDQNKSETPTAPKTDAKQGTVDNNQTTNPNVNH